MGHTKRWNSYKFFSRKFVSIVYHIYYYSNFNPCTYFYIDKCSGTYLFREFHGSFCGTFLWIAYSRIG